MLIYLRSFCRYFYIAARLLTKGRDKPTLDVPYDDGLWVKGPATFEQLQIETQLDRMIFAEASVLHIGIGSSHLAKRFAARCKRIDGITVMQEEVDYATSLRLPNYKAFLMDKYGGALQNLPARYDFIIDNNLASYAPSREGFRHMMRDFIELLRPGGHLLTHSFGMKYHRSYAFGITDADLVVHEDAYPVQFIALNKQVRGLIKIHDNEMERSYVDTALAEAV